jgi:hypothetical protein
LRVFRRRACATSRQRGIPLELPEDTSFEKDLAWVPSLDGLVSFACMTLIQEQLERFERTAFQAAKVRNVSNVGRQIKSPFSRFPLVLLQLAGSNAY